MAEHFCIAAVLQGVMAFWNLSVDNLSFSEFTTYHKWTQNLRKFAHSYKPPILLFIMFVNWNQGLKDDAAEV